MNNTVVDKLMMAMLKNADLQGIKEAVEKDPGLISRGWRNGTSPWIFSAMLFPNYEMTVPLLLGLGADIDATQKGTGNISAISLATAESDIDKLRFLLEHGAKPTKARAVRGAVVAMKDQLEMVKLLDQYGADIHEVGEGGFSGRYANPLSLAKNYGLDDVVEYLESRGCMLPPGDDEEPGSVSTSDSDGPTVSDRVIDYFASAIGPPEKLSLIQIVPTGVPIAVHAIPAAADRPFVTLFTTGMSEQAMHVPEGAEEYAYAEIYIQLPADWDYRNHGDLNLGWPQEWLRSMAQYPENKQSWLGGPVTLVANGDPPAPLAPDAEFTTLLLIADQSLTTDDGKQIWFYRMMPLFTEERQLEIDEGVPALVKAFDTHDISMVVDMNRKNVAQA